MLPRILLTSLVLAIHAMTSVQQHVGFIRQHLCQLSERVQHKLVRASSASAAGEEVSAHLMECSRACMYDSACFGFSVVIRNKTTVTSNTSAVPLSNDTKVSLSNDIKDPWSKPGVCYFHQEYLVRHTCNVSNADPTHAYYAKYGLCYNGGRWDRSLRRCVCVEDTLMVGKMCTSRPRNCHDLSLAGYIPYEKEILVKPLQDEAEVVVRCTILEDGTAKTMIAYNKRSQLMFNHTWLAYRNRFGHLGQKAYWLGMEYVRGLILTSDTPSKLSVVAEYGGQNKGDVGEMKVLGVRISPESDGYRLTFTGHEETGKFAGKEDHCFRDSNGMRFSTHDVDNDIDTTRNCGRLNGAGWWFNSCDSPCNIFGSKYTFDFSTSSHKEAVSLDRVRLSDIPTDELSFFLDVIRLEIQQ